MPRFRLSVLGICPQCQRYLLSLEIYINLDRDIFIVIYMHDDDPHRGPPLMCVSTVGDGLTLSVV